MSKPKTSLKEPDVDNRLLDERGATLERLTKADFEQGDTGVITIRQSPIDRAVRRGTFTEQQRRAAEKLYMHWYRASMAGTVGSADPLRIFGSENDFSRLCATESSEFHWSTIQRAMRSVREKMDDAGFRGDHAVRLLELIICREISFAEAGQMIGFAGTAAEVMARTYMRGNLNILIAEWGELSL